MESKNDFRLSQVEAHFHNNDIDLGYRKLMDCAMDTQNMAIYTEAIDLTEWRSKHPAQDGLMIKKSLEVLDKIRSIDIKSAPKKKPIIVADQIVKSYGKDKFKLGPVSLAITRGQIYGLVGENGNGKTTLLRMLAKELSVDDGHIYFNFDETIQNDFDLRSHLIYIPQRTQRWYGSLKDNLKFVLSSQNIASHEIETRVLMMIARFGLWEYKHLKWNELSSGYKMRFELARTFLRQPKVLLLDEPLANLDILAQQVILEDLKSICTSIKNPIALILSSQQLYEVEKISDNVIYLKNGKQNHNANSIASKENNELIVELDSNCSRDQIYEVLSQLDLIQFTFNGGVYIAKFNKETRFSSVLQILGTNNLDVTYLRNISDSTRRFFIT